MRNFNVTEFMRRVILLDFILSIAKAIVLRWTQLATLPLPQDERDRQLEEFTHDLENETSDLIGTGRRPVEIAVILLVRHGSSVVEDAAAILPVLFKPLLGQLVLKGEKAIMQIAMVVILAVGVVLGIAGWVYGSEPVADLPGYMLAGVVAIGGGIGMPVAIGAALTSRSY